jgi:N-acetylmuramoyl-L-alanine amidase
VISGRPAPQAVRLGRGRARRRAVGPILLAVTALATMVAAVAGLRAASGTTVGADEEPTAAVAALGPTATATPVATMPPRRPIVALDPGHGGPDDDEARADRTGRIVRWYREGENSGAIYLGGDAEELREKDLTLRIALLVADRLEARDVGVALTRRGDVPVNLERRDLNRDGTVDLTDELLARVDLANRSGADLLVSIHFNAHPSTSFRGTYTAYVGERPFGEQSERLAVATHRRILRALAELAIPTLDRGIEDDVGDAVAGRHLLLLGPATARAPLETTMPGILAEPMFLTNPEEAQALRRADVQDAIAAALADGILEFLGAR